jgi:hypothetical protein
MSVIEELTDEEAYLFCILQDQSGIDQAEFLWQDPDQEHGAWRAWPFQWPWFQNMDALQIEQAARSVGKSTSIKLKAFAFPFLHPKAELMIGAPELNHLSPITGLIEQQFIECRLGREMLPRGQTHGITHRPFQMDFLNGSRIMGRIPQRDGKGFKGMHPLQLELDEAQDVPQPAWVELIETLKRGEEDARWRIHGVTRGVRDYFYKFTQPDSDFTVHRITAMMRPTWTDQEREEKIEMYGSRDNPDYRRNVYGLHGDSQSPLFVLARLMQCVDIEPTSNYNENIYSHFKMNAEMLPDINDDVEGYLQFPSTHLKKGRHFYAGADIGYTNHPTEILIFGKDGDGADDFKLTLLTRITLERISHSHQARIFAHVIDEYDLRVFGMDKTGVGLPLFQDLQGMWPTQTKRVKGFGFSEKILTGLDTTIKVDHDLDDEIEKAGIYKRVLEYSSDVLRDYVDRQRLVLPWDKGLLAEFQGQTVQVVKGALDTTGKKAYSKGSFHSLDAAKMAVLGIAQEPIDEMLHNREREREGDVILDQFIQF